MNTGSPATHIPLEALRTDSVTRKGRVPLSLGEPAEGAELKEAPWVEFEVERSADGAVSLEGRIRAELALACRRCLRELERTVEVELRLRFEPGLELWDEEGGVYGLEPDSAGLDLREPLREQLLLALPEYPLCEPDCRGLCPRCGADLNEESCDCRVQEHDPRWDALRELETGEQDAADGRQ